LYDNAQTQQQQQRKMTTDNKSIIETTLNDQEKEDLMNAIKNAQELGQEEQIYLELEKMFIRYPAKFEELEREIMKLFKSESQEKDGETGGLVRCITESTPSAVSARRVPTYSDNPFFKPVEFTRFDYER